MELTKYPWVLTRRYKYTQQHMKTSIKRCVKDYVHLQLLNWKPCFHSDKDDVQNYSGGWKSTDDLRKKINGLA